MTHRRSAVGDQGRGTLCRDQRCDILTGRGTPRRALPKSSGTFHVPCCTENRELEVLATLISYPACICDICVICGQNGSNGSVGRNSTLCIPCTLWSKFRSSNRARRSVPLPLVCIYIRIVSVQSVVNTVRMDRLLEAPPLCAFRVLCGQNFDPQTGHDEACPSHWFVFISGSYLCNLWSKPDRMVAERSVPGWRQRPRIPCCAIASIIF